MNSIFGTAKATQEADNVFILQAVPETAAGGSGYKQQQQQQQPPAGAGDDGHLLKFLDVKKNRFDGRLGSIPLDFDPDTLVYSELNASSAAGAGAAVHNAVPSWQQQNSPRETHFSASSASSTPSDSRVSKGVVETVFPASDDIEVVPVREEDAFSILTK